MTPNDKPIGELLAELEELLSEATPGPWAAEVGSDESFIGTYSGLREHEHDGGLPIVDERLFAYGRKYPSRVTKLADACLVVLLRNNAARLIAIARAAQGVLEEARPRRGVSAALREETLDDLSTALAAEGGQTREQAELAKLREVEKAARAVADDIGKRGGELIRDGATLYIDPPTQALFAALAELDAVRGGG